MYEVHSSATIVITEKVFMPQPQTLLPILIIKTWEQPPRQRIDGRAMNSKNLTHGGC